MVCIANVTLHVSDAKRSSPLSYGSISKSVHSGHPPGVIESTTNGLGVSPNNRILIIAYEKRTFRSFRSFRSLFFNFFLNPPIDAAPNGLRPDIHSLLHKLHGYFLRLLALRADRRQQGPELAVVAVLNEPLAV